MKTLTKGAVTATYVYNALGQFVKQSSGPSGTVLYAYDEAGHLLGEYNSTGGLIQETIWMGDTPVATIRPGTPVVMYYVHTDHLDTPRRVTRPSDNKLMWTWYSDPFGTDLPNENPASGGTFKYNLRFPGQLYDSHAGLNQNYFRDYDPAIGRYTESDPLGLASGVNTYAYVNNDPISLTDPFGLQAAPGSPSSTGCSYYKQRCAERGGLYYCHLAQTVCQHTPDNRWTRCVRKCLQDADTGLCKPDDSKTCKGSDPICIINIHQICWQECLRKEGPPSFQ
jgi:RHS repeat-associated protein